MVNNAELVTLDDMDEGQRQLAELIGLENYRKIVKTYGGTAIYVPKYEWLSKVERDNRIIAEYNGYNTKALARKYGLTDTWIRNIVADKTAEIKAKPLDGQITAFDLISNE